MFIGSRIKKNMYSCLMGFPLAPIVLVLCSFLNCTDISNISGVAIVFLCVLYVMSAYGLMRSDHYWELQNIYVTHSPNSIRRSSVRLLSTEIDQSCWRFYVDNERPKEFHFKLQLQGLWNLEVQCRIHKDSLIIPVLSWINPIPCIDAYFLRSLRIPF